MSPGRATRRQTYVALLRGINLGARNKVSMADLRTLFASLGGEDVTTYVQSGNVVFKTRARDPDDLSDEIERRIDRDLGLRVAVLVRTKAQIKAMLRRNPLVESRDSRTLHVTFLAHTPTNARARELERKQFEPDEFRVVGREVYLYCPNGYGRSKLSNAFIEQQLGVAGTTRNWRTVARLTELV